jgi:hypothetical protein
VAEGHYRRASINDALVIGCWHPRSSKSWYSAYVNGSGPLWLLEKLL